MTVWKDYLVIFGGAGEYIEKLKVHESYKDLRVYDIWNQEWLLEPQDVKFKQFIPQKRLYHTADQFGGMLLIHGGFYAENKEALKGFCLYDLYEEAWIGAT